MGQKPFLADITSLISGCSPADPGLVPPLNKLRIIKHTPNLILTGELPSCSESPRTQYVIKIFRHRSILSWIISPFRESKAFKSYKTAIRLVHSSLATPRPVIAVESRKLGFVTVSSYVTRAVDNCIVLRKFIKETCPKNPLCDEVLELLANYALHMHDNGIWHRDFNLSNFLLTGRPGSFELNIIDLNRAKYFSSLRIWHRALDLARLDLYQHQEKFFKMYCRDRFKFKTMLAIARLARSRRSLWRNFINKALPNRKKK